MGEIAFVRGYGGEDQMPRAAKRVAIITGGAQGLGVGSGRLFATEGWNVFLTDTADELGMEAASSYGCDFIRHDVSSEADWENVIECVMGKAGRIDALVNNAGIYAPHDLHSTTVDVWHRILDVNAMGVFLGMRSVARIMGDQHQGSIVNVSSIAGLRGGPSFAYGASKWAIRGMTRSAARQLAAHNVRVNCVHPGVTETGLLKDLDASRKAQLPQIPIGRVATVEDVTKVVLFLASEDSSYVTGQEFIVDGGVTA